MSSSAHAVIHHHGMESDVDETDTKSVTTDNSNTSSDYDCSDSSVTETATTDASDESSCVSFDHHDLDTLSPLDEYGENVKSWTERVPIGLGLCPWAIQSRNQGRLKYVTCEGTTKEDVSNRVLLEADALCQSTEVPSLSTTLIVCAHVCSWNIDFLVFDQFVKNLEATLETAQRENNKNGSVTLVSFHPKFLRWFGLPTGVIVGSTVQSHRGMAGFRKSSDVNSATILEIASPMFGQRKVKVQFHKDQKEQYVPVDWLILLKAKDNPNNLYPVIGPPLPENLMHRSPYPTIHLIRNQDLGSFCARDVSRVKRLNAQKMHRLGWEGVEQKTRSII